MTALTASRRLELYRQMLLVRRFDERLMDLFGEGRIKGTAHACCGQEASAVGVCAALTDRDQVTSTHRGHGHLLAKGGSVDKLMAELFGRVGGYSKGRGGSQHVAAYEVGFLGSNGITAGGLPIATGAALALSHTRQPHVVAAFFGDGAVSQGAFHEAINLAGAWKLPVIFVCENNLYAMGTVINQTSPVVNVAERGAGYGLPGVVVDGQDLEAVYEAACEAAERGRRGDGPTLLECKTYRYFGHSKGDVDRRYRTRDEEDYWHERDPLLLTSRRLLEDGTLNEAGLAAVAASVDAQLEAAVQFALSSPEPDPAAVAEELFAA